VAWSLGEYLPGGEVWKAFKLPGACPPARGIYSNQPSPHGPNTRSVWTVCLALVALLAAMMFLFSVGTRQEEVFQSSYTFSTAMKGETSFVTPVFELKGRPSNVEVRVDTDLENDWAYLSFTLINEQSGEGFDFSREISYYHGIDTDGSWSEGGRDDRVLVPSVPAGRYYLRVEPDMNDQDGAAHSVRYQMRVRRDVPYNPFFWIAGLLLLVPPVFVSLRAAGFEKARWEESSYVSESKSDREDA
jgi:hypothetical protein